MTRIVTSIVAPDVETLISFAANAPTTLVELRLDALRSIPDLLDLRRRIAKECIATLRPTANGGRFAGSEEERKRALFSAIEAGFEHVDVEHDAPFLLEVSAHAAASGRGIVVSRHDLESTATEEEILAYLEAAAAIGIAKYVSQVRSPEDLAALVAAALSARGKDLRFAVMGLEEASLRVLAPSLGCALAYASHPAGPPAAAGQLPADRLASIHERLAAPSLTGRASWFAVIGDPVEHTRSPAMHMAAFAAQRIDAAYLPVRVPESELGAAVDALKALRVSGFNVTTPHKARVVAHLDKLEGDASFLKTANTVVPKQGRWIGYNTDGAGALGVLREANVGAKGARCLVLGAGSTGAAIGLALRKAGAILTISNRTAERARALAAQLGAETVPFSGQELSTAVSRSSIVVNATEVGRDGKGNPAPSAQFRGDQTVFDVKYGAPSPLLAKAAADGARTLGGERLLLHQGALAFTLFTGRKAPLHAMREAIRGSLP